MTVSTQSELIWQGRLHIGDEPGVYGDAAFVGLGCEFPITLHRYDVAADPTLVVHAADVTVYQGYPGHRVAVTAYLPSPTPNQWEERLLAEARLMDSSPLRIPIPLAGWPDHPSPLFVSVHIRADTTAPAGLYDDFTVLSLKLLGAGSYYASFGF